MESVLYMEKHAVSRNFSFAATGKLFPIPCRLFAVFTVVSLPLYQRCNVTFVSMKSDSLLQFSGNSVANVH